MAPMLQFAGDGQEELEVKRAIQTRHAILAETVHEARFLPGTLHSKPSERSNEAQAEWLVRFGGSGDLIE